MYNINKTYKYHTTHNYHKTELSKISFWMYIVLMQFSWDQESISLLHYNKL